MRKSNFDPNPWYLIPTKPGIEKGFRRWNLILIPLLAFLVVGAFVAGIGSQLGHARLSTTKVPLKIDNAPPGHASCVHHLG